MFTNLKFETDEDFAEWLLDINKRFPKLVKKHYKLVGQRMNEVAKRVAKQTVGQKKGNYMKKFKGSKVWEDMGSYKVSAYNSAPHSHLIEFGHRLVKGKNDKARVLGFVKGKYVMTKAANIYSQDELVKDLNEVIDKVLKDGGF